MKAPVTIFLFFILSLASRAQENALPPEANSFLPKGFESADYITGDLNGDKKPDALLVLKPAYNDSIDNDNIEIDYSAQPLLVLIRQADGRLKQVLRNDAAIMCSECGGVFGNPYNGITIDETGFNLSFYGGSYWRWGYNYRFAWKSAKNNWYLVREIQTSANVATEDPKEKTVTIEESELGEVPLDSFSSSLDEEASQWKVKSAKTFFYNSPILRSHPRKGYLLKGDEVRGSRQLKNFVEVIYDDGKGNYTSGYLLKKDLEKIQ